MTDPAPTSTYRLEPRDAAGLLLGLELVPCVFLGTGLLVAVLAVTSGLPIAFAATIAGLSAGAAFGRYRAMPLWEWLTLGARWSVTSRRRQWRSPLWNDVPPRATAPPCLADIRLRDLHLPGGTITLI